MKPTWHILKSTDEAYVREVAMAKGWLEHKVQVRTMRDRGKTWWLIEPFEKDCNCPSIIRPPHNAPQEKINIVGGQGKEVPSV